MTRRDFSKDRSRQVVAGRGYEPIDGGMPLFGVPPRRVPKDELRSLAQAAMSGVTQIKRVMRCTGCHHQFIRLQPMNPPFELLPCKKCGEQL